jgi:aminoglycoside N3'-acetyltransferase
MEDGVVSRSQLEQQLRELGVKPGGVLLVHTAFSKVKPVQDGPVGLIAALRVALGPEGTLVMPSMTDDYSKLFDPKRTPCLSMGAVADIFWRLPGALRSGHPLGFAALGPKAAEIAAPYPIEPPHGTNTPVGRVWKLDGQVLLLGVGHEADTTIHLAENIVGVRYRGTIPLAVLKDGRPTVIRCRQVSHCLAKFNYADRWLDEWGLQRRGMVGQAEARLARSRDIVEVVSPQLRDNETIFLHEKGYDVECDEARDSLLLA